MPRSATDLLGLAESCLDAARAARTPGDRFVAAHLTALRAAAAVLAARAFPGRRRSGGPRSAWVLLADVAPEMGEWAAFFAATARSRAAVEAGVVDAVTRREADDLLRDAESFLVLVRRLLLGDGAALTRVAAAG
jgi:hypothetical protein